MTRSEPPNEQMEMNTSMFLRPYFGAIFQMAMRMYSRATMANVAKAGCVT